MSASLPKKLLAVIETLNEDQLHALYKVVVERLNLVHKMRALYAMQNFNLMDRVSFTHNGKYYEGIVNRLNQKTITVILDDGTRWNVTPGSLTKLDMENPFKDMLTKEQWEKIK